MEKAAVMSTSPDLPGLLEREQEALARAGFFPWIEEVQLPTGIEVYLYIPAALEPSYRAWRRSQPDSPPQDETQIPTHG